jgi:hypothetical protein
VIQITPQMRILVAIVRPSDLTNYNGCEIAMVWGREAEGAAFQTLGANQTTSQRHFLPAWFRRAYGDLSGLPDLRGRSTGEDRVLLARAGTRVTTPDRCACTPKRREVEHEAKPKSNFEGAGETRKFAAGPRVSATLGRINDKKGRIAPALSLCSR